MCLNSGIYWHCQLLKLHNIGVGWLNKWVWGTIWSGTDRVRRKYWEDNLSWCHLVHHKSYMDWPVIEPGPLLWAMAQTCEGPVSCTMHVWLSSVVVILWQFTCPLLRWVLWKLSDNSVHITGSFLVRKGVEGAGRWVKWLRLEADHSPPSEAEVESEWRCTWIYTYALMVCSSL
jgi:hypothetical protein